MRLTIVIAGLGGGGAERVCVNLANAWLARGHEPTILTISQNSRPPAYAIDPGVTLRDIGWPRHARSYELNAETVAAIQRGLYSAGCGELVHDITMLSLLRYAILSTQPDVVVSFIDQTNVRVLAAMHETKLPVIACEVTDTRRVIVRRWERARGALYTRAAAVVAPDPAISNWLAHRGARATAIPNPLIAPSMLTTRATNGSRRRLVSLSRLSIEKRPILLLRAFADVAERHPDWDLEFYGIGPQRNTLEHLAEELASPGRIRVCGFTNDPYGALAGADLFVSSSSIEGFGNAIWEALACGVPVIAMDAGPSVRALVRHGVDGLIVPSHNIGALASALERLMTDDVERNRFAARAPEVVNRFSLESALKQWDDLLMAV
jgi:glycosyltransferase involved in cell wall biosynthesis